MTEPMRRPAPAGAGMDKNKRNLLIGGGVIGLVAFYFWYRKQQAASVSSSNTSTLTPAGNGLYYDANGNLVDANGNAVGDTGQSPYGYAAGTPSLYGYYDPNTGQYITGYGSNTTNPLSPGTEGAWTQQVIAYFTQQGFDTGPLLSGLANWLSGPNRLNPQEYTAVETAIEAYGMPPGITKTPALAPANQTTSTATQYGTQVHAFPNKTNARGAERQYSVPNATDNEIEIALRRTGADPRNVKYMPYYVGTGGYWPPKARITMWVVTRSSSTTVKQVPQFPANPAVPT